MMWFLEKISNSGKTSPRFSLCCMQGKITLPLLVQPPETLHNLLHGKTPQSRHFGENIRSYNMMFSVTSLGGKIDNSINSGSGPSIFRMYGQNFHMIGSLLPTLGQSPKFAQLYIYDTENEVTNRIRAVRYINYIIFILLNLF